MPPSIFMYCTTCHASRASRTRSSQCCYSYLISKSGEISNRLSGSSQREYHKQNIINRFFTLLFLVWGKECRIEPLPNCAVLWKWESKYDKTCHEMSYHFECDFFLFGHLLSCCGFLTCFQSSYKVILISLWLCLQCFCLEIKAWSFLSTWFLMCILRYCRKNLMTSHLH